MLEYLNIQVTFVSQIYSKIIVGGKLMLCRLPFSNIKVKWDSACIVVQSCGLAERRVFLILTEVFLGEKIYLV